MLVDRSLSFTLAVAAGALIWQAPELHAESAPLPLRAVLALLLIGIALCLAHGLDLRPSGRILSRACRPPIAWGLCMLGLVLGLGSAYL